jgi:hypothetical protein
MIVALQAVLTMAGTEPAPEISSVKHGAEPTRGILAQRRGQSHLPDLPTSVPRALAVFNLTDEPRHGRLTRDQLDSLLLRVRSIRELPKADRAIVVDFARCARDQTCPPAYP